MANKAKSKTAKQIATENAYKALAAANEIAEKSGKAEHKDKAGAALRAYNTAKNEERRERFQTVGRDRGELVVTKLAALAKCANKKGYDFNSTDIDKLETYLQGELADCILSFRNALAGAAPSVKGARLSFD